MSDPHGSYRPDYNPYITALIAVTLVLGFVGFVLLLLGQAVAGGALMGGALLALLLILAAGAIRWTPPAASKSDS